MNLLERDRRSVWHPYTQMKTSGPPIPIARGEGARLYTEDGRTLIDGVSSWWVNLHGHAHPYIAAKVAEQLGRLEHVIFAGFTHQPAVELAERLLALLPSNQAKVFFSDNGSTAVEVAIKMALQYFHNQGQTRRSLVAFDRAFHGETFGAMSASGDLSFNAAFEDHLFEVLRLPAPLPGNEAAAIDKMRRLAAEESIYAFIFEPLAMGAAGMLMYRPEALDELMAICRAHGILCIADEVMTGFGRTGRLFASQYLRQPPDLICLAKGLTGGTMPLAVTTCTEAIFNVFLSEDKYKTFFHGHSFTANPAGCAAALASLDLLETPACRRDIERIAQRHAAFREEISAWDGVRACRALGTILAVEFHTKGASSYFSDIRDRLYAFFLERGVLLRPLGNVVYLMPPYCVSDEELDQLYDAIREALRIFGAKTNAYD
jgi:adenosylmethionine-8-amino-7-oxononanoate aminotransferase